MSVGKDRKFNAAAYAKEAATRHLGTKELRRQISRKAYERRERRKLLVDVGGKRTVDFFVESDKDYGD